MRVITWPLRALDFLLPMQCALCQQYSDTRHPLCSWCKASFSSSHKYCPKCGEPNPVSYRGFCSDCPPIPFTFDRCRIAWEYSDGLRHLIHQWKFEQAFQFTATLADLVTEALPDSPKIDALIPMPLHWRRFWQRGYNQCELLANTVGRATGVPMVRGLKRINYRSPQHQARSKRQRALSAEDFSCRHDVKGLRLALIDDVMTTGNTANAAASCLKQAGARSVELWCIARTRKPRTTEQL
jgi:ComF family protein